MLLRTSHLWQMEVIDSSVIIVYSGAGWGVSGWTAHRLPSSLVPRPSDWGEGERRPVIHCVRMRRYYSDFE